MASNQKGKEESPDLYTCHICRVRVPSESKSRHEGSYLHQAGLQIASAALERLRAHVAPISEPAKEPVEPSHEKQHTDASFASFCGSCASVFPAFERVKHIRTNTHFVAAMDEQIFENMVRGYVDEEEIQFLEGIFKDPCDDEERAVDKCQATATYTCNMCALDIPTAFRNEHELSSRHRACLAIANAASQRTIAFLTPTPIRVDTPTKTLEDKMVALLKVYTGVDIKKQEHIETEEEIEVDKDKSREVKKRLTPKEYFKEIMPLIQYIGGFYTLIIDDTDYVTIKTEKDTYLRVHVGNFSGLYNIGSMEEYEMKCRMCDGLNMNVSYSSKGNIDKLHIMSLGHIKNVLTPVSVHGIRKIDNTHSSCILCNVFIPTHSVEEHIMRGIQHTAFLAEALEKGKLYKESDNDMKFIIYTAPPVDRNLGFFMEHPPPNFNSVLKPQYDLFGQGKGFGQKSPASSGFGQSTRFGQSAGQSSAQPATTLYFGKSGTLGDSVLNKSSGKKSFIGFGQFNQPMNLNSAAQPTMSLQSFGNDGTFGQSTGTGFGQSTGTGLSQSTNTGFGPSTGTGFGQNTGTGFGQLTTGFGQRTGTGFGQSTSTGFGQSTDTGFGQSTGTGFGQSTGTGFGQSTGTGFGQSIGTGFGQSTGTGFGQSTGTGFGQSPGTVFGQSIGTGFGQSIGTGFGLSNREAVVNSSPLSESNKQATDEEPVD